MKRFFALATLSLAVSCICAGAFAQDRNITILNFANETGDDSGATMAATTQGIVATGVRYIGTFKIIPTPSFKIGTDATSLKEYADLTNSEYVIFGKLMTGKGGTVKIENDLYCHADDSIFKAEETAENALDVFSASDAISVKVLSELYKTKIAYGTITLKISGPRDKFDVYVNDVLAGSNVTSISSIPDGEKQVRVIARSGRNDGKVLFNDKVVVKPNASTPINVSFEDLVARVTGKADKGLLTLTSDPPGMLISVDEGDPVLTPISLEITPGTHKFEPYETCINDRYYAGQPIQWVIVPAGAEAVIPIKPTLQRGTLDYSFIPEDCAILLDGKEVTRDDSYRFECDAGYYNLQITRDGNVIIYRSISIPPGGVHWITWGMGREAAYRIEDREISFKANATSWDDIKPFFQTDTRQIFGKSMNYSISGIKFARDKKYLYWHVDFNDTNPLASPPSDAGEFALVQLDIQKVKGNANLNIALHSNMDHHSGLWDDPAKQWTELNLNFSRVQNKNSVTGRIALSDVRKYLSSAYQVSIEIASKDWTYSTYRYVGWVDFGFLAKK